MSCCDVSNNELFMYCLSPARLSEVGGFVQVEKRFYYFCMFMLN
jgi:hypothetical protein